MNQFAKEQSRYYLDAAQMTYKEKLQAKASKTKSKAARKLARFKGSSDQANEAHSDMLLYMNDYMNDLVANGMSESEALEKAKADLTVSHEQEIANDYNWQYERLYEQNAAAYYETVGLFYPGFLFIGIAIGGLTGYFLGGGQHGFLQGGWIDTLVGLAAGVLLGLGAALISHALFSSANRRSSTSDKR